MSDLTAAAEEECAQPAIIRPLSLILVIIIMIITIRVMIITIITITIMVPNLQSSDHYP